MCSRFQYVNAERVWKAAREVGKISLRAVSAMLRMYSFSHTRDVGRVASLWEEMEAMGVKPDQDAFYFGVGARPSRCARRTHSRFCAAIRAFGQEGDALSLKKCYRALLESGLPPSQRTLALLIEGLLGAGVPCLCVMRLC
jgi:pentatricopeptide repeat protein